MHKNYFKSIVIICYRTRHSPCSWKNSIKHKLLLADYTIKKLIRERKGKGLFRYRMSVGVYEREAFCGVLGISRR